MALITRIDELKPFVAIGEGNYIDSFAPAIDGVEQNEIIQALGQAQYDQLHSYYNDSIAQPDANLDKLLPYVQRAIANLAIAESMDFNQVRLTASGGLTRSEKETEKTAYHYQKLEAQDYLYRQGYQAIESLLKFLEANKVSYPIWQNSEAYTVTQKYLITGTDDFQQYYNINRSRRTYQALLYIIDRIETLVFEDALGTAFMDELKSKRGAGTLSAEERKLLNSYVKPALAYLTIAAGVHELGMDFSEKGVQLKTRVAGQGSIEKKQAESSAIENAAGRAESNAHIFLQQMREYLLETASETVFPLYYQSDLYPKEGNGAGKIISSKTIYNGL